MPQQLDSIVSTLSSGTSLSTCSHRRHHGKRFLVAMAVQQRFFLRQGFQFELEPAGVCFARQKFLEQHRIQREFGGCRRPAASR